MGPPAGGGFRRLASAAVLAPTRCVWSLRVRPFGSPSSLRGAAACCARLSAARGGPPSAVRWRSLAARCARWAAPGSPRAVAWSRPFAALRSPPSPAVALLCGCGSAGGPCGAPWGAGGLLAWGPSAPGLCSPSLFVPRPPVAPVALRAAAAAAAAFLLQKVIVFHPFKLLQ